MTFLNDRPNFEVRERRLTRLEVLWRRIRRPLRRLWNWMVYH